MNTSAAVCKDFSSGYCRFGNSCRFYHPPSSQPLASISGVNRIPLGQRSPTDPSSGISIARHNPTGQSDKSSSGSAPRSAQPLKYQFNEDTLEAELSVERPNWTLSSFGAAKYEPNLFFGYDLSQEELRWKCVVALKENRAPDYVKEEADLLAQARTTISQALSNLPQTRQLAETLHNARYPPGTEVGGPRPPDFSEAAVLAATGSGGSGSGSGFRQAGGGAFGGKPSAFGGRSTLGGFGTPATGSNAVGPPVTGSNAVGPAAPGSFGSSAFGQRPSGGSAFGTSAFGSASRPAASAFGSGTAPTPAFRSSSAPTAFASTSGPSSGSKFGTSAFGAKRAVPVSGAYSTPISAFGSVRPSAFGSTPAASAFGSSAFGASSTPSAFGGAPNPSSAFGSSAGSAPGPGAGFGPSAFGQTSRQSAFGQSNPSQSAGGFAAFGQSSAPTSGAFGASSSPSFPPPPAFGTRAAPTSFGGTTSAFGNPFASASASSANPFRASSQPPAYSSFTFPPDVVFPPGWSYDDPWSWLLPTVEGNSEGGKLEDEVIEAFRKTSFEMGKVPVVAPPVELR